MPSAKCTVDMMHAKCIFMSLFLTNIFHHKSINSRPIAEFEADPRPQKYLETCCVLRLFPSPFFPKFQLQQATTSMASGLYILMTYSTTSRSILVQLQNLKQIQDHGSTSKLTAYSDRSQAKPAISMIAKCSCCDCRWYVRTMIQSTTEKVSSSNVLLRAEVTFLHHF